MCCLRLLHCTVEFGCSNDTKARTTKCWGMRRHFWTMKIGWHNPSRKNFPCADGARSVAESTEKSPEGLLEAMTALEDLRDLAPGQGTALFLKELGPSTALGGKSTPQRHAQLARLLRDRRLALGNGVWAGKTNRVSASTLKQIERGVRPSRKTLFFANAIELELNSTGFWPRSPAPKPGHRSTATSPQDMSRSKW